MKKKVSIIFALIALVTISCKSPNLVLSPNLSNETSVYEVKGRQGWQFNQVITYGDYTTSKVKRGWTSTYNVPFIVNFQGAKEKLSFTQYTPQGKSAEVFCVSKFKSSEIRLLNDFFSIPLEYENNFAGTIAADGINWDFIIYEPNADTFQDITYGDILNHNTNEIIEIRGVKKVEGQANFMAAKVWGFEFFMNGKSIGAVSLINNGRVWLKNDLNEEIQLVLSSVITGLIVRHDVTEAIEDTTY